MKNSKPTNIPCYIEKNYNTTRSTSQNFPYRELVGALLYLSTRFRPDISQAVNDASKKTDNPSKEDIIAVKKIMKYLNGTRNKGILFRKRGNISKLDAYCDADYADCTSTRRSMTGYIILFSGAPISWCSKKQPIVALSSTEAEYIAVAVAVEKVCI